MKTLWLKAGIFTSLLLFAACTKQSVTSPGDLDLLRAATIPVPVSGSIPASTRKLGDFLEKEVAQERAARISNVRYEFQLSLPEKNEPFAGYAIIYFYLSDIAQALTLDFVGGQVTSVRVNGQLIDVKYNDFFITLPADVLTAGEQKVEVLYSHDYRRDGRGLHWFNDPVDGESYVFTQFEVWDFNKVFPGFDQPDLKATYKLAVEVPEHWQVITSGRESGIQIVNDDRRRWYFPESKKFSTYLLPLHAGPYRVWEEEKTFRIPLRLFARASYAANVQVVEWFEFTRQGFDFFEDYFDYPYPFEKYDQLLVPEFNFGAMENIGAVTFRERFQPIGREQTELESMNFAVVVMHEMAHHWFGDLVTMKWWDDIWLNESFADLMGWYATANATKHRDAMTGFFSSRKPWGYEEDRWVTTHPITQHFTNTDPVITSIDGITYAKGAAALVQLKYLIGDDKFQEGLAEYFNTYAWTNTELKDFIGVLAKVAERDLNVWTQQWLMQSGVNTLEANFQCEGGKLSQLTLEPLPANDSGVLREHRLDILLLQQNGNRTIVETAMKAEAELKVEFSRDILCPVFVLPNASDHTFASIRLDESSRDFLVENFSAITEATERGMVWRSLWEAAIDGDVPATEVLDLAIKYLPLESDASSLATQLEDLRNVLSYLAIRPFVRENASALRDKYRNQLESVSWKSFQQKSGSLQQEWFDLWAYSLHSDIALQNAVQLLEGKTLADDDQWLLVAALIRENHPAGSEWAERLLSEDNSASTQLNYWIAQANQADVATKLNWIKEAGNPDSEYSYNQLRNIFATMFPFQQYDLHRQLAKDIADGIPPLVGQATSQMMTAYVSSLLPVQCNEAGQQTVSELLQVEGLSEQVVKVLRKHGQSGERCIKAQQQLDLILPSPPPGKGEAGRGSVGGYEEHH